MTNNVNNDNKTISLHGMFHHAAGMFPDNSAVIYDDGENVSSLTYTEVKDIADQLSNVLRGRGCTNEVVGVCMDVSEKIPYTLIGIMSVPACYHIIDLKTASYDKHMIQSLKLQHILLSLDKIQAFEDTFSKSDIMYDYLKNDWLKSIGLCLVLIRLNAQINQSDLAYCITTSGTTGQPKIVSVPHSCIVPNITHLRSTFHIVPSDLLFLASPLTFDPSVVELFLALSTGAAILIVPAIIKLLPDRLVAMVTKRHQVTVLQMTPTLLTSMGSDNLRNNIFTAQSSVRILALGGEEFPPRETVNKWIADGNNTEMYNLYGITEVSCWATCCKVMLHEISADHNHTDPRLAGCVPLGEALSQTHIEVRDLNGDSIHDGTGELFIGGEQRRCLINTMLPPDNLVGTGDQVCIQNGQIYYLGRLDDVVKRNGIKLNLTVLNQTILQHCRTMQAKSVLDKGRLLVFVSTDNQKSITEAEVRREIERTLPRQYTPDDVVILDTLPITKHGKVDRDRLLEEHKKRQNMPPSLISHDLESVKQHLRKLWVEILGMESSVTTELSAQTFIECGGDSFKLVTLMHDVERDFGFTTPLLLDVMLQGSFTAICQYLVVELNKQRTPSVEEIKTKSDNYLLKRRTSSPDNDEQSKFSKFTGECHLTMTNATKATAISRGNRLQAPLVNILHYEQNSSHSNVKLTEMWAYNTGKCVDASPLAVVSNDSRNTVIYIGSHSHRFSAVSLTTGECVWETTLGDRIESSACLSVCGKYVVVGCYDNCIYALTTDTGDIYWKFRTGGPVKCSPCIDPDSSLAYCGSHDGRVYALDLRNRTSKWSYNLACGSIFSSPAISHDPNHLYVATLGGHLTAICPVTGDHIWTFSTSGKPMFSSPVATKNHVYIGAVDNNLYCVSAITGDLIWYYATSAPIFSSPCVVSMDTTLDQSRVLTGSHDKSVYCLSTQGELIWKFETDSFVYATPFTVTLSSRTLEFSKTSSRTLELSEFHSSNAFSVPDSKVIGSQNSPDKHKVKCTNSCSLKSGNKQCSNPISEIDSHDLSVKICEDVYDDCNFLCNSEEKLTCDQNRQVVIVCSTSGTVYILNLVTGQQICSHKLLGEVFSSPIVCADRVIVGCRDNNVYCLSLQ